MISRRGFIARLSALGAGVAVMTGAGTDHRRYGRLDVRTAQSRGLWPARVYVDGIETTECIECDDIQGWVREFVRNKRHQLVVDPETDTFRSIVRYGRVLFMPGLGH